MHLAHAGWRLGEVVRLQDETPRVRSLWLRVPDWPGHRAGQHVDVRLTAEDGYQAQRSYSIASAPEEVLVEVTVERLEDGEVSPYLTQVVAVGDRIEVRGPIGGYFVWDAAMGGPLLLVAGGSGVVPLMAMARHRAAAGAGAAVPCRVLYSCRGLDEVISRDELQRLGAGAVGLDLRLTLTRQRPPGWAGYERRVDLAMLREVAWTPAERPLCYVCGPSGFVETVAGGLAELGHVPERIRTERFGPSAGV